jgi:predicted NUDIX family phosphoesterase
LGLGGGAKPLSGSTPAHEEVVRLLPREIEKLVSRLREKQQKKLNEMALLNGNQS